VSLERSKGKREETILNEAAEFAVRALLIGVGATAFMDFVMTLRQRLFGVPAPDYGLVGRWLAYMPLGRFHHRPIDASPPIPGERILGWIAHYLIGTAYATILLAAWGVDWSRHPTILPALIVGIGSVLAPFLIMQPGMGAGIAASRTPNPGAARLRSLVAHTIFGIGLYVAGLALSFAWGG
jgi:Protein of unknown function (DUF2938)